ncbi:MAG: hypothetical protein JWM52_696 [Candidatus Saccharibacteria bacterium]|nr:hypothetical protein [Candidatus Saccharibacteria bacterium]
MTDDALNIHSRPNRSYELVNYNPAWVSRFEKIAAKIAPIFGDNLVKIEHVGSTAVPGMTAKPTIDISVQVKDLSSVMSVYDKMKSLDFRPLGDFIQQTDPEEYFVLDGKSSHDRLVNVHVMQLGNPEIEDMITLRDFLRSNSHAREDYIKQKKILMDQYGENDYNTYSKQKRSFLEELKTKARQWKSRHSN